MSEQTMRKDVVKLLKAAGMDAFAVENPCLPGTPDVNYVEGWIELKQLDSWPARKDTPVVVEHFTTVQRIWLKRRCDKGGAAFVLLKVGLEWLLFWGRTAVWILGEVSQSELRKHAIAVWQGLAQVKIELPRELQR